MVKAAKMLRDYNHDGTVSTIVGVVLVVLSLYAWLPAFRAFAKAPAAGRAARPRTSWWRRGGSRPADARKRSSAWAGRRPIVIVAILLIFVSANRRRRRASTFFDLTDIKLSFQRGRSRRFWTNIWVACVAEVLVLIFGLLVAIVRMLPGPRRRSAAGDRGGLLRRLPGHPGDHRDPDLIVFGLP